MEDNSNPNSPGGVMDVQPPKNGGTPPTAVAERPESPSAPASTDTPSVLPDDTTTPVAEEAKPINVTDDNTNEEVAPTTTEMPENPSAASSTQDGQSPTDNPLAIDTEAHPHKSGAPVVAVILAIVIALVLTAITVFAYLRTKDDTASTKSPSANTVQPKVSAQDVDQTSADIDSTINSVDDVKDFAAEDLTEKSLGL